MRFALPISILALVALAAPGLSQVPDDRLIVPGQRIGTWTLEMTVDQIVGSLGRQDRILSGGDLGADIQPELRAYGFLRPGLLVYTRDRQSVLALDISQNPEFVTDKGVKFDMPRAEVEPLYGQPTRVTQWRGGPEQVTLWFNEIGLYVGFSPTRRVWFIGVFRPGTASSLWKP